MQSINLIIAIKLIDIVHDGRIELKNTLFFSNHNNLIKSNICQLSKLSATNVLLIY